MSEQERGLTHRCRSKCGPWQCSKPAGHDGEHEQHGADGGTIAEWKGRSKASEWQESSSSDDEFEVLFTMPEPRDDVRGRDLILALSAMVVVYTPLAMHFTGTLLPTLTAMSEVFNELLGVVSDFFERPLEDMSSVVGESESQPESQAAEEPDLDDQHPLVVLIALPFALLMVAGMLLFALAYLGLGIMIGLLALFAGLVYLWLLIYTPILLARRSWELASGGRTA